MDGGGGIEEAKQYALICVEEIITSIEYREGMNPHFTGFEYWENVIKEIKEFTL